VFALEGRRVVITGAGGGIGSTLVRRFADAGASVVACDAPGVDLSAAPAAERHAFDMTDRESVVDAAGRIAGDRAPDVVVSNAGRTRAESLADLDHAALAEELTLNLRGAADLTLALLPALRAAGGGSLVFVSSVNAILHLGNPAYSAAKAGLNAWARSIAAEEGRHGIRANVIAPGSTRTAAWDHRIARDPAIVARVAALYPLGRLVEPDEVASAALFIASPLASGITGVTLPVDCGFTAGHLPFINAIA
jgi:NAD(P)-dependent dehydrogenase (short-subunit alcohol dehydrogenase family)